MSLKEGIELNIIRAVWVSNLKIHVEFSDGFSRTLDFEPFLSASSQPETRRYLNVERFKGFSICYGNLVWNDYDLCFSLEDLYSDNLRSGRAPQRLVAEDASDYGKE